MTTQRVSIRELALGPLRTRAGRWFLAAALVGALVLGAILGATGASELVAGLALVVWVVVVVPLYLRVGRDARPTVPTS